MKNKTELILFCALTTCSALVWAGTNPKADYQSFIPKNWKVLSKVQGDLNGDKQTDLALIIENTDPKNIVTNEGLGNPQLNLNNRKLLILFKAPQGYRLVASNYSLPTEGDKESPCLADPLGEGDPLTIKNGLVKINLHYWLSCGSWSVYNNAFTFRYQNQSFKLVGYDTDYFHRASGETSAKSINFLTGKIKNTTGGGEFENQDQAKQVSWSKLKNSYSLKLEQINFKDYGEFE